MAKQRVYVKSGEAARIAGIHPNTLRWYETAGYLPPVPRTPGGYRLYTPQLCILAWMVHTSQPLLRIYGPIRRRGFCFLFACRDNLFKEAEEEIRILKKYITREHELAIKALDVIEKWRRDDSSPLKQFNKSMIYIGKASKETEVTRDQIISWERNRLCQFPRTPQSGYRLFGREEIERLLVIRYCRIAGYSITAIRRMLQAIDSGKDGGLAQLKEIADTPHPDETALFPVFPTDTLPKTLQKMLQTCKELEENLLLLKQK